MNGTFSVALHLRALLGRAAFVTLILLFHPLLAHAELVEACPNPSPLGAEEWLKGPIKTFEAGVAEIKKTPSGETAEGARHRFYSAHYDRNGNMLEEVSFREAQIDNLYTEHRYVYTYDPRGALATAHGYGPNGAFLGKTIYEFDEAQRTVTAKNYFHWRLQGTSVYKYDKHHRVVREDSYDRKGERTSYAVYRFDVQGNLVETKGIDQRHSGKMHVECTYDKQNRPTRSVQTLTVNSSPLVDRRWKYEYVDDQVILSDCGYGHCYKSGVLSYGPGGEIKEVTYMRDGSVWATTLYSADGRMVRWDFPDGKWSSVMIKYEDDAVGNWTKAVTLCRELHAEDSAMKPCRVRYRNITYYDDVAQKGAKRIDSDALQYLLIARGRNNPRSLPRPLPFFPSALTADPSFLPPVHYSGAGAEDGNLRHSMTR